MFDLFSEGKFRNHFWLTHDENLKQFLIHNSYRALSGRTESFPSLSISPKHDIKMKEFRE